MTTVQDLLSFMETFAPITLPPSEDNAGLLAGRRGQMVGTVMVTLDITRPVIEEAVLAHVDLLIAHHPVTFGLRAVTGDTMAGDICLTLAEHHMAAICMHQNWDAAEGGVNDCLAHAVGLSHTVPLSQGNMGRVGALPNSLPVAELAQQVKAVLGCGMVRLSQSTHHAQKIAVGSGSSGAFFADVLRHGCDTFITGDCKHSLFLEAGHHGVNLIDAGHFATENIAVPPLAARLTEAFPDLTVLVAKTQTEPFVCL